VTPATRAFPVPPDARGRRGSPLPAHHVQLPTQTSAPARDLPPPPQARAGARRYRGVGADSTGGRGRGSCPRVRARPVSTAEGSDRLRGRGSGDLQNTGRHTRQRQRLRPAPLAGGLGHPGGGTPRSAAEGVIQTRLAAGAGSRAGGEITGDAARRGALAAVPGPKTHCGTGHVDARSDLRRTGVRLSPGPISTAFSRAEGRMTQSLAALAPGAARRAWRGPRNGPGARSATPPRRGTRGPRA
jgi:hypothetical protein